jgi:hypothetical protein
MNPPQSYSPLRRRAYFARHHPHSLTACDSPEDGFQCSPSISRYWGQYSPYYSVKSEINIATPPGCDITFVQALYRHGARDPTASKSAVYAATISRLQASVKSYGKGFEFLQDYEYRLGADQLSHFGEQQLVNAGIQLYQRYQSLVRLQPPFMRSAGQERVVNSARKWAEGFHQAWLADDRHGADANPYSMVVIDEAEGINNTLSHGLCPAFETGIYAGIGREAEDKYMDVFAPDITTRLNAGLLGANLSNMEASYLMDLCPFETVVNDSAALSSFCALFLASEWAQYDYYQSLGKWYGTGSGNPLGPTQGVGWTNELIARLTGQPVKDHTSTNSTLDAAPDTFPLNRTIYADFSHDNDMMAIYGALGLFNGTKSPSNETWQTPEQMGGYSASRAVPFAARMFVEKMQCAGEAEELVRILVNNRVIPLRGCGADGLGRCKVSSFVDSLSFARSGGRWEDCFS